MTTQRVAGAAIGVVFGLILCWSGMTSPDLIRSALLFEESYLYLFMGSSVGTAALGTWLLQRSGRRALFTGTPIAVVNPKPARRHIAGSAIFGLGWGVSGACPGPIATQVGQGIGWALFTLAGVAAGVYLFQRRAELGETEPATEQVIAVPA